MRIAQTPGSSNPGVRVQAPALPVDGSVSDDPALPTADTPRERPPAPEQPYVNPAAIQARMTDAHAHLQDAAKPCLALEKRRFGAYDQFRFGYTLTYAKGQARVSNLRLVWSDLKSEAVETCLFEKLTTQWAVREPDWLNEVEDALVGPDLE